MAYHALTVPLDIAYEILWEINKRSVMKKKSKSAVPKVDPYLEGLMAKLLERLGSLDKKMDRVIAQASGRTEKTEMKQQPQQQPQRRDRVLYEAICADCHKICEVPFKPSEARPVYCKECFAKRKAPNGRSGMPVLTPVAMAPKPMGKLNLPPAPPLEMSKKSKKTKPAKKTKKKK